ncbi:MAG: ATP-binding protein [Actinomycetota bacterium]|nr:ATP-binding protein [Actinomycetota bacterium]
MTGEAIHKGSELQKTQNILIVHSDAQKAREIESILESCSSVSVRISNAIPFENVSEFDLAMVSGVPAGEAQKLVGVTLSGTRKRPEILIFGTEEEPEEIAFRAISVLCAQKNFPSELAQALQTLLIKNAKIPKEAEKSEEDREAARTSVPLEQRDGKSAEELATLIEIAAHEIRHPATVFKGYSYILREQADNLLGEVAQKALAGIESASEQLAHLVSELLDTARIERETFDLSYKEVTPEALILRAVQEVEFRGYKDKLATGKPINTQVRIDPEKTKMALSAILDNALKYSPEESIIMLWAEKRGEEIVFFVGDRGPGIPVEEREAIFERFYKGKAAKEEKIPGLGLGLYIAKSYIEAQEGWIRVEPRKERGSIFSFGLPVEPRKEKL